MAVALTGVLGSQIATSAGRRHHTSLADDRHLIPRW